MNERAAAVGVLIVLAAAIGAYIFFSQPEEPDPWAKREEVWMDEFAESLASSSEVYIVMDLRGADAPVQRNIMQCSADLASSTAIGGKSKRIYSLENECLRIGDSDGETPATLPLSQCLSEIGAARDVPEKAILYVRKANETHIFANELVVGMGANYAYMDCRINSAAPPAAENQGLLSSNESGGNATGPSS